MEPTGSQAEVERNAWRIEAEPMGRHSRVELGNERRINAACPADGGAEGLKGASGGGAEGMAGWL